MFILYIVVCPLNYLRYFRNKFLLNLLIERLFGFKIGETRCLSTQV